MLANLYLLFVKLAIYALRNVLLIAITHHYENGT